MNRPVIDKALTDLLPLVTLLMPGEMNYVLTKIILAWGPENYSGMAEVLGLLEAVKLEYYRRVVAPYENEKRYLHGDVF